MALRYLTVDGRELVPVPVPVPMLPHWPQVNSPNNQASRVKYVQLMLFHNSNTTRMRYSRASGTELFMKFPKVAKTDVRYQSGKHAELEIPPTPLPWH